MPKRSSAPSGPLIEQPMQVYKPKRSIRQRMTFSLVLLTAGSILLLGLLSFLLARSMLTERILWQVASMAAFREDFLEDSMRIERERTALIAARFDVRSFKAEEDFTVRLHALMAELQRERLPVLGISLLSADRQELARTGEASAPLFSSPSASTVFPVVDRKLGWRANDVYVPLGAGFLAVRYDAAPILATLFDGESLGSNRDVLVTLGLIQGGEVFILHHSHPTALVHTMDLGSAEDPYIASIPLTQAVQGIEGMRRAKDEQGRAVLAAYRFLPTLGWGMAVEVQESEGLKGIQVLSFTIAAVGLLLLALSTLLARLLAHSITAPLLGLSAKIQALRPGNWAFERTVHSGDEVEVLDAGFADLTSRLRDTYDHLEEKVTERTEELNKRSMLDHAILDTIDIGVIVTDGNGKVTDANPAALRLLKWEEAELKGKRVSQVIPCLHRHKKHTGERHPVETVIASGTPYRSRATDHISLQRKDTIALPVTLSVVPLVTGKKILGTVVLFQDMTEERQIDYLKSEFISLASHQLRTPLSSIRWYTELLAGEDTSSLSASQKSYFKEISHASQRMADLLEALLHVARLEDGGLTPDLKNVSLSEMIAQIGHDWTPFMKEKGVTFSATLPTKEWTLRTDPVLLHIVLQNFLGNALKYTPKGHEIGFRVRNEHGRYIFSVQDSGVGIPVADQKRVFEKFFRAHNVRQMDTDGTGLGLYMSKAIAEKLGGSIFFESEEGRGSTFTLVLPARPGSVV